MIQLPVRLELKSEADGSFCRFTIVDVPFDIPPVKNDTVDFGFDDWPVHVIANVQSVYHVVGTKTGSVVCCLSLVPNNDQLVRAFDLFKDSMKICDPDTGGTRPPPYYPAYRVILKVWGKKNYSHETDVPTVLAEIMKASLMVAGITDLKVLITMTEFVHKLLLEHKQRIREDYPLMSFIRDWDKETKLATAIGSVDEHAVIAGARQLLAGFKSIPVSKWPSSLA